MDFLFSTNIEIAGKLIDLSISRFGESDFYLKQQGDSIAELPEILWIWLEDNRWNCSEILDPLISSRIFSVIETKLPVNSFFNYNGGQSN